MTDGPIRIAFIGCGRVAQSHAEALRRVDNARLVAAYDRDETFGRARAAAWGVSFRALDELLDADDIDAVYVLTPMESHYAYAKRALERGKHVLIEKPVSDDVEGIRELSRLAARQGKACMPGHSYLYVPEIARMQRLVRQSQIGRPASMFMSEIYRMPDELAAKYHGPTVEVLCHHLYLMLALLGTPERVQAFAGCLRDGAIPTGDEQVSVQASFASGALAHLFISWAGPDDTSDPWTFKLKVLGTGGGMHFSRKDVVYGGEDAHGEQYLYDEMFESESHYFINRCIRRGEAPLSTMEDAAVAMTLLRAVQASIRSGTVEAVAAHAAEATKRNEPGGHAL